MVSIVYFCSSGLSLASLEVRTETRHRFLPVGLSPFAPKRVVDCEYIRAAKNAGHENKRPAPSKRWCADRPLCGGAAAVSASFEAHVLEESNPADMFVVYTNHRLLSTRRRPPPAVSKRLTRWFGSHAFSLVFLFFFLLLLLFQETPGAGPCSQMWWCSSPTKSCANRYHVYDICDMYSVCRLTERSTEREKGVNQRRDGRSVLCNGRRECHVCMDVCTTYIEYLFRPARENNRTDTLLLSLLVPSRSRCLRFLA